MASSINRYHKARSDLVARLGGTCQRCGCAWSLQFHHNNPYDHNGSHGIGGWQQVIKIRRELNNGIEIILLCRDCHEHVHKYMDGVIKCPMNSDADTEAKI